MITMRASLNEAWQNLSNALERVGLNLNRNTTIFAYSGENFAVRLDGFLGPNVFIDVRPHSLQTFVPYPNDLPLPRSLHVYYDLLDLTPDVRSALKETGARIINQEEVMYGHIEHSSQISELSYTSEADRPKNPFMQYTLGLQKPSERYANCIAPVEPGIIDRKMLPYHRRQKEHDCIPDEVTEFPFLPLDFQELDMGLNLNLHFWDMEDRRARQLFSGFPLPINTTMHFGDSYNPLEKDKYTIFLTIGNGKVTHLGNGAYRGFELYHRTQNLEDGVLELVPHFLRFYSSFVRQ